MRNRRPVGAAAVGAQALDVELVEGVPMRGKVQPVRVGGRAGDDLEWAHPAWRQQRPRGERGVLRVDEDLVARVEVHVAPMGVQLGLALILALLQQGTHVRRHLREEAGGGLTVAVRRCRVWLGWSVQWAARVLAAVRVEERVAGAERRRGIVDGELDDRGQLRPVVAALADEGPKYVSYNTINSFRLAGGGAGSRR